MLAPSSALLRFLRAQSQDLHFFTPSNKATICHSTSRTTRLPPNQINSNPRRSYPRNFSASHRHHANVEASLFNLDLLGVSSKQGARNSPAFIPTRWQNTSGSRTSLEGQNKSLHTSEYSWPSLSRFWGFKRRRANPGLRPNDLPPLPSFLDDASGAVLGRSKVGKASNELKLRCTEVNENGDVTLVNGEFKKSELIAKVQGNSASGGETC